MIREYFKFGSDRKEIFVNRRETEQGKGYEKRQEYIADPTVLCQIRRSDTVNYIKDEKGKKEF